MWQQRVGGENLQDKNWGDKIYVFTYKYKCFYMCIIIIFIIIIICVVFFRLCIFVYLFSFYKH